MSVGLPHRPDCGGERRAQARHSAPAFHRGDQGRLFAADESAGAFLDGDAQRIIAAQQTLAQPAAPLALGQRRPHPPQGLGILVADVEDGLVRADRDRGDGQPFDDAIRERFEDHPVHERARVAFVAVADHILGLAGLLAHHAPFLAGGKPRAAAPAQAGLLNGLDDLFRRKRQRAPVELGSFGLLRAPSDFPAGGGTPRHLGQRGKTLVREALIQVQRVEPPVMLHGDVDLAVEKRPHRRHHSRLAVSADCGAVGSSSISKPSSARVQSCDSRRTRPRGRKCCCTSSPAWSASAPCKSRSACPAGRPRSCGVR